MDDNANKPLGFDLKELALSQDFPSMAPTTANAAAPSIRKPSPQWWVAFSKNLKHRQVFPLLEMKDDREYFVVAPQLRDALVEEWHPILLVLFQTRQGAFFLCPIRMPDQNGKLDTWNTSGHNILHTYAEQWIRRQSDMQAGGYRVVIPISPYEPPMWPENTDKLFEDALKGRVIDSLDHPTIKKLRGGI